MGIGLLADTAEDVGNREQVEKEIGEAVNLANVKPQPQSKPKNETKQTSDDGDDASLPPKYRGKTREQIIEMHINAESQLGRMANDLGTQRKLTDRLLDLKRETDLQQQAPAKISRSDLLDSDDPTPALDRFVDARLSRKETELNERLSRMEASLAQNAFVAKHPDYIQYANDTQFVSWCQASPYRVRLTAQAVQGDFAAADELLTEYKSQQAAARGPNGTKPEQKADLENARRASLESGGAGEARNDTPTGEGKIYRRADLIRLRMEKPEYYYSDDVQAVLTKAYLEKRVR